MGGERVMAPVSLCSSTMSTLAVSSLKSRTNCICTNSKFFNPLSTPRTLLAASHRIHLRRLFNVQATTLRENEDKFFVEETFQPKNFPDERYQSPGEHPNGKSSSSIERWVIKFEQSTNIFLTDLIIKILDVFFHDRDYPRFFFLETVARVPYFAFISVLHIYESCGWWRRADYLKVHFAESWNEMHHLLIMEDLGGNAWWFDRFLAQNVAILYYFMTIFMYAMSPRMAYHFSECVENRAFETYDKFVKEKGDELKKQPPSKAAVKYYTQGDMYMFDEFQTARIPNTRRPIIENLYDVFTNIRDDEAEHCKTMKACQTHGRLRSPHADDSVCVAGDALCEGIVDCLKKSVANR